jgi:hypothetical protein
LNEEAAGASEGLKTLSPMNTSHTASSATDCSRQPMLFQDLGPRKVVADFSGGTLSSDGGVLLLRQIDQQLGLSRALAGCFCDQRDPHFVDHSLPQLLAQRLYGLALGYEDLNDHNQLRRDPLLATACEKKDPWGQDRFNPAHRGIALAGASTLNRLELSNNRASRGHKLPHDPQKLEACLLEMAVRCLPKHAREIVLDLDAMGHRLHGLQEGGHFSAYYDDYCYLPLYVLVGDLPLWAQLRTSDQDGAAGVVPALEKIVAAIRKRCRRARIIVRGDGGFCRDEIMLWCEGQGVFYCLGLSKNSVLLERLGPALADARARRCLCGAASVRVFAEFDYQTAKTWSRPRRVVGKAEVMAAGENPRFVVTNLPAKGFKGDKDRARFSARLTKNSLCAGRDGECAQATGVGLAGRSTEHALPGKQPTAFVVGDAGLSVDGTGTGAGLGRDGTGAGDGGHGALEALESGGASDGERAPGVCAFEQRLSAAGAVSALPSAVDGDGAGQRLTEEQSRKGGRGRQSEAAGGRGVS